MTIIWTGPNSRHLQMTNVAKIIISVFGRVKSNVGKGENAGNLHFFLFTQCFQQASFSGSLEVGINWQRVNDLPQNPGF